jgi:hypothetical protein
MWYQRSRPSWNGSDSSPSDLAISGALDSVPIISFSMRNNVQLDGDLLAMPTDRDLVTIELSIARSARGLIWPLHEGQHREFKPSLT